MSDFIELRHLVEVIVRRWWVLVLLLVIAVAIGYSISVNQAPVYQATTTLLVGQSLVSPQPNRVDIQTSDALVSTYVDIARRQPILEGVVKNLNLSGTWLDLKDQIEVKQISGTQLIEIKVKSNSPEMARGIANEIANQMLLVNPESSSGNGEVDPSAGFNGDQILYLQQRILNGQKRLAEIEATTANSESEAELEALQNERTNLEQLMNDWQRNYSDLLPLTSNTVENDANQLTVIETAYSKNTPIGPRFELNMVLSGGVGLLLASGIIFLLDFLDDSFRSPRELSESEHLNVLGSIGRIPGKKYTDKVITCQNLFSPLSESYRILRSRIQLGIRSISNKSIMVTSVLPREGKTVAAANLGVVFAQANMKTVIVDANLRDPQIHLAFDVKNENGLGDMLYYPEARVEDYLKATPISDLFIVTGGQAIPDPSEQLGSKRMVEILDALKGVADVVILDSPPLSVFSDAINLANQVDNLVLVVKSGAAKRNDIRQVLYDLQNTRAKLLGVIFNFAAKNNTILGRQADPMMQKFHFASPARPVEDALKFENKVHEQGETAIAKEHHAESLEFAQEMIESNPQIEQNLNADDNRGQKFATSSKNHRKHFPS